MSTDREESTEHWPWSTEDQGKERELAKGTEKERLGRGSEPRDLSFLAAK